MRRFLEMIFKRKTKEAIGNKEDIFLKTASQQLKELAQKGLSIPVFTL
jgi:hypothetical protein